MKKILSTNLLLYGSLIAIGQIKVIPSEGSGSGYDAILNAGLDLESPDCVHTTFGPHITQAHDELLDRNIFEFHSHIVEDNDRCQNFDRVRMEIKGGPNTNEESQHQLGGQSFYRWKFLIPADFKGSSSFCHVFQNKAKGGGDDGFPVLTITPRTNTLQVIHNGGDTGDDLGAVVNVDLAPFLGNWIEAYVYQKHAEEGELELILKDLKSGRELVTYKNENIDLWRTGADYSRPKWGVYRKKVDGLKDETFLFADFCISESSLEFCPADSIVFIDSLPPSAPANLKASSILINSVDLLWEPSSDNFGVKSYIIYQGGDSISSSDSPSFLVEDLEGGTTYEFSVRAVDEAQNLSDESNVIEVTTDASDALPSEPLNPYPRDKQADLPPNVTLSWDPGENTDTSLLFFGTEQDLQFIATQSSTSYNLTLDQDSIYYWQIGQKNINGVTLGPIWSFSTGIVSADGQWLVYRGDFRPHIESIFLIGLDIPESPEIDQVLTGPIVPTNNIYQYYEEGDDKFRWRYEFEDTDTAFTAVARIKAFPESNNISYFEVRLDGVRDKLRINHSTFKLEKSTPVIEEEYSFDFDAAFHIVRVTMSDQVMRVYLDEEPLPFIEGFSETVDFGSSFDFGKSGGTATGGFVDWMTIIPNQAYAPNEGPSLPADLIISHDASLSSILVEGKEVEGFSKDVLMYDITFEEGDLPTLEVIPSSHLASYTIDTISDDQSTSYLIKVLAQDGFSSQIYKVSITLTSAVDNVAAEWAVKIYPNPSSDALVIRLNRDTYAQVCIFDVQGSLHHQLKMNEIVYFRHNLSSGLYLVEVKFDTGQSILKKIMVR